MTNLLNSREEHLTPQGGLKANIISNSLFLLRNRREEALTMQQPPNDQQPTYPPTQPYTQYAPPPPYPMQQPPYSPMMTPPKPPKRKRPVLVWIILGLMLIVGYISYQSFLNTPVPSPTPVATQVPATGTTPATTQPPAATPTPTHALKWTTVQTFSGNGEKKTGNFTVPDSWRILWTCQGLTDGTGIDGILYINVYNSDGTPLDPDAVGATCAYGKVTSDNTEEHTGGTVYLDVNTGLSWTIKVQVLK
jgi:hypothetical protein